MSRDSVLDQCSAPFWVSNICMEFIHQTRHKHSGESPKEQPDFSKSWEVFNTIQKRFESQKMIGNQKEIDKKVQNNQKYG